MSSINWLIAIESSSVENPSLFNCLTYAFQDQAEIFQLNETLTALLGPIWNVTWLQYSWGGGVTLEHKSRFFSLMKLYQLSFRGQIRAKFASFSMEVPSDTTTFEHRSRFFNGSHLRYSLGGGWFDYRPRFFDDFSMIFAIFGCFLAGSPLQWLMTISPKASMTISIT